MDKRKNNLEWLRAILDANGVSQKEVAAAIGEAPANFNRILNGGRTYREGSEKLGKLKAFCQKRFGLVSGDWDDPPRSFAGSPSLREIADRFSSSRRKRCFRGSGPGRPIPAWCPGRSMPRLPAWTS